MSKTTGAVSLLRKKTKTVLVPLILFNAALVPIAFLVQYWHVTDHGFSLRLYPFDFVTWLNAVTAFSGAPINYPLNFLRDLYLVSLAAPVAGYALRRLPWVGLALVFVVFWFNFDRGVIERNDMPITFYCGGLMAIRGISPGILDRYAVPLIVAFVVLSASIVVFEIENRNYLRIVAPFLIWPSASLLVGTSFGVWLARQSRHSFFIFLCHGPLLVALWLVYSRNLSLLIPYWIWWTTAPVIVVSSLTIISGLLRTRFPRMLALAIGGR